MGGHTTIQTVGPASPEQIAEALARVQQVLGHLGEHGGFPVGSGAGPIGDPDKVAQLQHLASLRAQGALTNQEFAEQARHLVQGQ